MALIQLQWIRMAFMSNASVAMMNELTLEYQEGYTEALQAVVLKMLTGRTNEIPALLAKEVELLNEMRAEAAKDE